MDYGLSSCLIGETSWLLVIGCFNVSLSWIPVCWLWLRYWFAFEILSGYSFYLIRTNNSGSLVLEHNLFQKTVREAICSKTTSLLSPERRVTDHTAISMKMLSGRESRLEVLLDSWDIPLVNNLVKNWGFWESRW